MSNPFKLLSFLSKTRNRVEEIRQDPVAAKRSKRYAIFSIITSLIAVGFGALSAVLFPLILGNNGGGLFIILLLVLALIACAMGTLLLWGRSLTYLISQFSINRNPLSWIALGVLIASIAAVIIIFVLLI